MARYPDSLQELGTSGLATYGGYVYAEEMLDEITPWACREYIRMAEGDSIVGSALAAIQADFLAPGWSVESASDKPEDKANKDFVEECMNDMEHPWSSFLEELFHFLYLRFALFEVVYKQRGGPDSGDKRRRSKYTDGRIGWRKFSPRAQETIRRWQFSDVGEVEGAYQWDMYQPRKGEIFLPIERLLHFHTPARNGNPAGKSILRNCHRDWSFRRRMEVVEGIGTERNLAGMPWAAVPSSWLSPDADDKMKAALAQLKIDLTSLRADEQACLIYPLDYDDKGREKMKVGLMSATGRGNVDTDKAINRYDRKIAMSLLTDFLLLGHESVGSFALATIKLEMFSKSMNTTLDRCAEVPNEIAIPRLFSVNGIRCKDFPWLKHETAKAVNSAELATALMNLSKAGFPVNDVPTQNAVRGKMTLPEVADDAPVPAIPATGATAAGSAPIADSPTTQIDANVPARNPNSDSTPAGVEAP